MATRTFARGLAKSAKRRSLDLGWGKLTAPLEAVPLQMPALKSLKISHSTKGPGHTGARKFKALLPMLRWQNPEASIGMSWDDDEVPKVVIELDDGSAHELPIKDHKSGEVLRVVLEAAGAHTEEQITANVDWADEFCRGRPATAKSHEMRRYFDEPLPAPEDVVEHPLEGDDSMLDAESDGVEGEAAAGEAERR